MASILDGERMEGEPLLELRQLGVRRVSDVDPDKRRTISDDTAEIARVCRLRLDGGVRPHRDNTASG